ncbi:unnamed protein product [Meloidogyne enterolobii]|uniref:Uncharacterized protein n=1 Tax=Meloidogyne enterolobii TaxID=390850 RepID=A0ACB0Z3A8_MELEN
MRKLILYTTQFLNIFSIPFFNIQFSLLSPQSLFPPKKNYIFFSLIFSFSFNVFSREMNTHREWKGRKIIRVFWKIRIFFWTFF